MTSRQRLLGLFVLFVLVAGLLAATLGPVPTRPATAGPASPATPAAVGAAAGNDQFGDAADFGSMAGKPLAQPVVGIAPTVSGDGYWLVARDGGIFSFGDAVFRGSTGGRRLNQPIVGMTPTPSGGGYWFVAADGGIFSFGDAAFAGSTGGRRLAQPIVSMASTPSGGGYWLVARDGGVFTFGDAGFHGSDAGRLAQPVVTLRPTPSGRGYWIVTADGRVVPHGDATGLGSGAGRATTGFAATATGRGYWLAGADGAVRAFGDAPTYAPSALATKVVGMAATPSGRGYWLATASGSVLSRAIVQTPQAVGPYEFLATDRAGKGMRYDPCSVQHYVVNPAGAPAGAVAEVEEAFRRLSAATGITFASAGTTTETHIALGADASRRSYQPERYGVGRWAPVLVSWTTPAAEPVLSGSTLGYGGSTSYWLSSTDQAYVTGEVVFDRDLAVLRAGFGAGLTRGNLVLHELAHVIGLDHVDDRAQVMYPSLSIRTPDGYGPGDRAGLALLGASSGCLDVATPR